MRDGRIHAITSIHTISSRRAYLHVYYDKERAAKEHDRLLQDEAMEGRIFIGFISLIITSYIRKVMDEQKIYRSYSLNELYSEFQKTSADTVQ